MQETLETWVQSLGQEDPLEEGMAIHSSILAWRVPWTERSLVVHNPWDCKELDTTEVTEYAPTFLDLLPTWGPFPPPPDLHISPPASPAHQLNHLSFPSLQLKGHYGPSFFHTLVYTV